MFEKGEYIIYGSSGVCQVEEIGTMEMPGTKTGTLYYTLLPAYTQGSKIFTPVENTKIVMRRIMTREEALDAVSEITKIEPLKIQEEKKREEAYKEALRTCTFENYVKVIKTLYIRRQLKLEERKKLATLDERYLKLAEDSLYGELAISLQMEKDEVEELIAGRVLGEQKVLL